MNFNNFESPPTENKENENDKETELESPEQISEDMKSYYLELQKELERIQKELNNPDISQERVDVLQEELSLIKEQLNEDWEGFVKDIDSGEIEDFEVTDKKIKK